MTKLKLTWPDKSALSKGAFAVVKKLRKAGHETYIAGGAVRDAVLKRPIEEIDIATSATPTQVKKLFKKTIPTGEKHGTITAREGKQNFEITTFRSEGKYVDNRRPGKVRFIKSAEKDAGRRDFTINALFYDPESKEIIDHVNGLADISHQKIRLVGESERRIKEDALRMLRAVRFAAALGFGLTRDTQRYIKKNAKLIHKISAERVKQELDYLISSKQASVGFGMLDIVGLLEHILPEIKNTQGVKQPRNHHAEGDVYAHTLLALEQFDESYDLATRWAVLFHDLGKPETRAIKNRRITFYDHQNVGAELAQKICRRLKFSTADTQKITWLVAHHMVPNDFSGMRPGTRRKWGLAPHFDALLLVYLADAKASLRPGKQQSYKPYKEGQKIKKEIEQHPEYRKPILSGHEVMKVLKIKPGPAVGKVLLKLDELKLNNKIKTKKDALKYLRKHSTTLIHNT